MMAIVYKAYLAMALVWSLAFGTANEPTLHLVGDSTMADKPYGEGNPEKGWGQVLPLYFNEGLRVKNHAVNGRSTKSFRSEGRWQQVLAELQAGDYVIIQFGHNDQKYQDSSRYAAADTHYRANLVRYVKEVRAKDAYPVLATPIVRRRFDDSGQFVESHGEYPRVVREVAAENNVPLLDLHRQTMALVQHYGATRSKELFLHISPKEYPALPEGKEDNTHLSAVGAFRVSDLAVVEIRRQLPALAAYLEK
jgi:lysophospholipase L1-like esterase